MRPQVLYDPVKRKACFFDTQTGYTHGPVFDHIEVEGLEMPADEVAEAFLDYFEVHGDFKAITEDTPSVMAYSDVDIERLQKEFVSQLKVMLQREKELKNIPGYWRKAAVKAICREQEPPALNNYQAELAKGNGANRATVLADKGEDILRTVAKIDALEERLHQQAEELAEDFDREAMEARWVAMGNVKHASEKIGQQAEEIRDTMLRVVTDLQTRRFEGIQEGKAVTYHIVPISEDTWNLVHPHLQEGDAPSYTLVEYKREFPDDRILTDGGNVHEKKVKVVDVGTEEELLEKIHKATNGNYREILDASPRANDEDEEHRL